MPYTRPPARRARAGYGRKEERGGRHAPLRGRILSGARDAAKAAGAYRGPGGARYEVDAIYNGEIGVVIRDYGIPGRIWSRPSADLRLATDLWYPESKIGPFWICPPVSRRSGGAIRGAGSAAWDGRTWQTFFWEVVRWDPRYDNLLTHLDVVDDRMRRDE